jgi:hypothetical protein
MLGTQLLESINNSLLTQYQAPFSRRRPPLSAGALLEVDLRSSHMRKLMHQLITH